MALKAAGLVKQVGILDFDMHHGDGTDELLVHHQAGSWIRHYSAGAHYRSKNQADDFIASIPERVATMRDCDLILYQAGADPHFNDPLGGFLTTAQLRERDRRVFEAAHAWAVPVAWNLAGGYQVDASGVAFRPCWIYTGIPCWSVSPCISALISANCNSLKICVNLRNLRIELRI